MYLGLTLVNETGWSGEIVERECFGGVSAGFLKSCKYLCLKDHASPSGVFFSTCLGHSGHLQL